MACGGDKTQRGPLADARVVVGWRETRNALCGSVRALRELSRCFAEGEAKGHGQMRSHAGARRQSPSLRRPECANQTMSPMALMPQQISGWETMDRAATIVSCNGRLDVRGCGA